MVSDLHVVFESLFEKFENKKNSSSIKNSSNLEPELLVRELLVLELKNSSEFSSNLVLKLKNCSGFSSNLVLELKNSSKTVPTVPELFFWNWYAHP